MRDLSSIDFKDGVRFVVRRELKSLGLKIPKCKSKSIECNRQGVFGVYLDKVPSSNVSEEFYCGVPRFLVDACNFLRNHLATEGLFRKSGSVQRQKLLKQRIEIGEKITTAHPHDVASLIKQFFRQLQEPLLTNLYHDSFIKALKQESEGDRTIVILYTCLMLPLVHLQTLQYFLKFAAEVATHSAQSGMSMSNLAIVLTPNLMHNSKKDNSSNASEKLLRDQTMVIEALLKHSERIGLVPEDIYEKAKFIGEDGGDGGMTSSGDELDGDSNQQRKSKRVTRARTRTGSLTVFLGLNKLKTNSNSSHHHRRSKSVKADLHKSRLTDLQPVTISKDDSDLIKANPHTNEIMNLRASSNKRRIMEYNNAAMSPAFKRRARVGQHDGDAGISHPTIVSRSTQMFTTSIKPLTPVKPLTDMVKKEHAKMLLTGENEHVKVIDAATYIPSPDNNQQDRTPTSTRQSATNEVFESPVSGKKSRVELHKRRVTRRNSSGATSCFNSSPRHRCHASNSKQNLIEDGWRNVNRTPNNENMNPDSSELIASAVKKYMPGTPNQIEVQPRKRSLDVVGSAGLVGYVKKAAAASDSMTPCKHHVATPPIPHSANTELKTLLSTKI